MFYALGVVSVSWFSVLPIMQSSISSQLVAPVRAALDSVPSLKMKSGRLTCGAKMPVLITSPSTGEMVIVIDTRERDLASDSHDLPPPVTIVTSDEIIFKEQNFPAKSIPFSSFPDFTLDSGDLEGWANLVEKILAPALLVVIIPSYLFLFFLKSMAWSLSAIAFASLTHRGWTYSSILRVTIVASTPSLALSTLLSYAPVDMRWQWTLPLVTASYLVYALTSLPKTSVK